MTIGIYAISFDNHRLVYIGQSSNIEDRIRRHKSMLVSGQHYNNALQKAHDMYRDLCITILEECDLEQLDNLEKEWISEFDAVHNGLNLSFDTNSPGRGSKHNSSKYTDDQIYEAFNLLLDRDISLKEVAEITDISYGSICMLAKGKSHRYLEQKFPDIYAKLLEASNTRINNTGTGREINRIKPSIVSPSGIVYKNISCIKRFAKEHGLNYNKLLDLVHGRFDGNYNGINKGWKLLNDKN